LAPRGEQVLANATEQAEVEEQRMGVAGGSVVCDAAWLAWSSDSKNSPEAACEGPIQEHLARGNTRQHIIALVFSPDHKYLAVAGEIINLRDVSHLARP
jgi:hypothetical protein